LSDWFVGYSIFNSIFYCLAVTCPAIRTDKGVTASGNTEEGSYGDVIHFECESNDQKIDGSSDIHCTETGEWSDSVPKCKGSLHCLFVCIFTQWSQISELYSKHQFNNVSFPCYSHRDNVHSARYNTRKMPY